MSTPTLEAPGDVLRRMLDDTIRAWDPVWQSWSAAMPTWPTGVQPEPRREPRKGHDCGCGSDHDHKPDHQHGHEHDHDRHHGHDHGCRSCARDACDCCVGEADLVVVTRLGESRIVPLVIHNEWRRERTVEVEVGDFSPACHEDALVRVSATTRPGGPITLAPCGRVEVGILLRTAPPARIQKQDPEVLAAPTLSRSTATKAAEAKPTAARAATAKATAAKDEADAVVLSTDADLVGKEILERAGALPDVGCCTTMYADVRVSGCGRPLRLAVVVLPLHCDAYEVDCRCGCC